MRTLKRLEHVRPPSPGELRTIEREEESTRKLRELFAWWRLVATCAALGLVGALTHWLVGLRRVEDGLAQAVSVRIVAPSDVRVAEIFCRMGQTVKRGDPLLRLEARRPPEERRVLELEVEQRRSKLALVEAGAQVGDGLITRRAELLDEAVREERLARADRSVAEAELERLERERDALAITLEQREEERLGAAAALDARGSGARAQAAGAAAERDLAAYDEERGAELAEQGIAPDRARVSTSSAREQSEQDIAGFEASARAFELESRAATRMAALEAERGVASLSEMDAALETARRRVGAAEARVELWSATAAQRATFAGGGATDPQALRALELELHRADLAVVEARLAALDASAGNTLVHAELDGVIDWLAVSGGSVVRAGEELLRYYDPESVEVVVYLSPESAALVARGTPCRLVPDGGGEGIDGRVADVGGGWVTCPEELPRRTETIVDLRLPVRVRCSAADREALRPGLRLKVRFADEGEIEAEDP